VCDDACAWPTSEYQYIHECTAQELRVPERPSASVHLSLACRLLPAPARAEAADGPRAARRRLAAAARARARLRGLSRRLGERRRGRGRLPHVRAGHVCGHAPRAGLRSLPHGDLRQLVGLHALRALHHRHARAARGARARAQPRAPPRASPRAAPHAGWGEAGAARLPARAGLLLSLARARRRPPACSRWRRQRLAAFARLAAGRGAHQGRMRARRVPLGIVRPPCRMGTAGPGVRENIHRARIYLTLTITL